MELMRFHESVRSEENVSKPWFDATGCPVEFHVGCERRFEPIVAATPHPVRGARCIARGTKETRTPSGVQAVRDDHGHQQPRTPCTPDGVRLLRHSLLYTCNS